MRSIWARVNNRVTASIPNDRAAREVVNKEQPTTSATARFHALAALIAAASRLGNRKVARKYEDWQVRRLAMTVLMGGGAGLTKNTGSPDRGGRAIFQPTPLRCASCLLSTARAEGVRHHVLIQTPTGTSPCGFRCPWRLCQGGETDGTFGAEVRTPPSVGIVARDTQLRRPREAVT